MFLSSSNQLSTLSLSFLSSSSSSSSSSSASSTSPILSKKQNKNQIKKSSNKYTDSDQSESENDCILISDNDNDDDIIDKKNPKKPTSKVNNSTLTKQNNSNLKKEKKRVYNYYAVDENPKLETEINKAKNLSELTEDAIEYMILSDINYFIDIYSGDCEHSWRHLEFKNKTQRSNNLLYERCLLNCFTKSQYMAATKGLQWIFCKKNNKLDDYIVKVLLPEGLIKICMRIYQCSKEMAENFLMTNNIDNLHYLTPHNFNIDKQQSKLDKQRVFESLFTTRSNNDNQINNNNNNNIQFNDKSYSNKNETKKLMNKYFKIPKVINK